MSGSRLVIMNAFLSSLLVLATFITLCNASCSQSPKNSTDPADKCKDSDGTLHDLKAKWTTKNCMSCVCEKTEISCCNIARKPVSYDKEKCEVIVDKECTTKVVERKDPKKNCTVKAWTL